MRSLVGTPALAVRILAVALAAQSSRVSDAPSGESSLAWNVRQAITTDTLRTHMEFLASDSLRGREPGAPEYDVAIRYVTDEFRRSRSEPIDGSYEQAFRIRRVHVRNRAAGVGGSDHSPLLHAGISALWMLAELPAQWMRTRYHTPKDDMGQPIDFNAAVRYTILNFVAGYLAAQDPVRPHWNSGDFFGSRSDR